MFSNRSSQHPIGLSVSSPGGRFIDGIETTVRLLVIPCLAIKQIKGPLQWSGEVGIDGGD